MHSKLFFVASTIVAVTTIAIAQPRREQQQGREPPRAAGPRSTGTIARPHQAQPVNPQTNPRHEHVFTNQRTGREEHHGVVFEHRAPSVIGRDLHARTFTHDYRPHYEWRHFYPAGGWTTYWGISDWSSVGTITCEAADESTGALYPVTAARDAYGWNDANIDNILAQALDECAQEAGPQACVAAPPPCTFTSY